jgi:hypothetical protein
LYCYLLAGCLTYRRSRHQSQQHRRPSCCLLVQRGICQTFISLLLYFLIRKVCLILMFKPYSVELMSTILRFIISYRFERSIFTMKLKPDMNSTVFYVSKTLLFYYVKKVFSELSLKNKNRGK